LISNAASPLVVAPVVAIDFKLIPSEFFKIKYKSNQSNIEEALSDKKENITCLIDETLLLATGK
jgi:hypothetical protein